MRAQKLKRLPRAGDGGTAHATGQEGNPARIWQNRSMNAFLCDELIRAGVIR
ncbi:hypothetical protein [Salmonella enterica]|uniref:hypothetical protein n=1 Tax=Salmonella enterica TaxID=28901 RepID=UPI0018CF2DD5|nr:hypothetical protein [Salmonella enterica]